MREIKFRAWDKKRKLMEYVATMNFDNNGVDGIELANYDPYYHSEITDIVLMQYTGLKDKNREESFHKDIVSAEGYDNWIIEWHNNSWKLKQIGIEHYIEIPRDFIIIGNEFENPELMEAK